MKLERVFEALNYIFRVFRGRNKRMHFISRSCCKQGGVLFIHAFASALGLEHIT